MPCVSSAEVIIATRAPAIIAFSTSSRRVHAAGDRQVARTRPYRIATQRRRTRSSCEPLKHQVRHDLQVLQVEVGLVEAVEQDERVCARLIQPRCAMLGNGAEEGAELDGDRDR